jgi:hypothetical protein
MLVPLEANNFEVVKTEFTIVQINAKWNKKNDVEIPSVPGCSIKYGYFEDQPEGLKSSIQYVPTVVLYKGNRAVHQWSADLSFRLELNKDDIEEVINRF